MALALCLTLLPATALAADGESSTEPHTHSNWLASDYGTDAKTLVLRAGGPTNTYGDPVQPDSSVDGWLLEEGAYYLKDAVTIDKPIVIRKKVTICLNGHTIESTAEGMPVFEIVTDGTLTLTDCGSAGKVTHASGVAGCGVRVESGTFNMYGGAITKNTADYGGGVLVKTGTTFNMYGGSITNNTATSSGGVFVSGTNSKFTMNGGTIAANQANSYATGEGNGGGVGVYNGGTFEMNGKATSVSNNTATGNGGGVYVRNGGSFNMHSGTITGNDANGSSSNGGGVYVTDSRSKFTMTDGSITGNTATGNGGGVYVTGGTFDMTDGTIGGATVAAANTATNGGGVYVEGGEFTMNGGTTSVSNNTATGNGGGVYVNSGTFNMNDGIIGGATAAAANTATNGGGVYVFNGTFNMNGNMNGNASITGNKAKQDGGGVCVSHGDFIMSGGSITGNDGNGVFVSYSANTTFTVSGAPTVTGNKRGGAASNVYLTGSGTFITIGGALTGGKGSIGVTKRSNSVIAKGVNEDCSGNFFSDDSTYVVKHEGDKLVLAKRDGTTTPPTHKHEWTYTATGAIITATCKGEGCDVSGSVAITKPANLTYDGTKKLAMVEESENWKSVYSQDITITYWESVDGSDTYTNMKGDAPTKVGKYKASITVGGQIAFVEYEITGGTPEKIPVTKITLSPASPVLTVGQTQAMTVVIEPRTATDQNLTWKSSDNSVATVENGTVTAKAPGTAEITATAVDGSGKSATCKVTVTDGTTPSQPGGGTTGGGTTGGTTGGSTGGTTGGGSSSGGSSSSDRDSHDSNPVVKTETKNNADGSTTKTETRKDGSVTQTTTGKDGSTSKTETKKDGSSVTENKAADGSTGTVKTDKHGQTTAETTLSSKAIETAKRNGEPVKAPVEVKATRNSDTAPTVKVELPKNSGDTKVEIPVSNVKPGTVAVLVHADGTEEIVKNSLPTEDGIQLTINGGATVKIVDNSKDFADTRNHWAKDAIDFVSARGLVSGMSGTTYAPDASTTRAQLWTILARQNDADLNGGSVWYEKAQLWSKDKGISDGTEPNAAINRAQMVTMLWRTMGQPAATDKVSFADVPAGSYYAQAVAWAVESGITQGVGGGRFDPTATCTRAQIAAFLTRLYAEK